MELQQVKNQSDLARNIESNSIVNTDTKEFNKGDREFRDVFENTKYSHLLQASNDAEDFILRFNNKLQNVW